MAIFRQQLDFARPQPVVKLRGRLQGVLLLAVSVALAAGLVGRYQELAEGVEAAERQIQRLTRARTSDQPVRGSREALAEEVRRVNEAALRLTIPWQELFRAVESAADRRVALLALQPNFQKRELKISGEAENFGAIRRYIEQLEGGAALAEVRLISHEVITQPGAAAIRFELAATWRARA